MAVEIEPWVLVLISVGLGALVAGLLMTLGYQLRLLRAEDRHIEPRDTDFPRRERQLVAEMEQREKRLESMLNGAAARLDRRVEELAARVAAVERREKAPPPNQVADLDFLRAVFRTIRQRESADEDGLPTRRASSRRRPRR